MTLTIDLSPEAERRLTQEAARQGQEPAEFARLFLEDHFPPPELEAERNELRRMVEKEPIKKARAFVQELVERWPKSRHVQHWARVLEPPRTIPTPPQQNRSFDREFAWLREHAHEYPGCWIAVHGDRLIAADPELARVHQAVREALGDEGALIHFGGYFAGKTCTPSTTT